MLQQHQGQAWIYTTNMRGYKTTYNRKGKDGENEIVEIDEQGNETILKTEETNRSKIKKAPLLTIEDVRTLLLELFK